MNKNNLHNAWDFNNYMKYLANRHITYVNTDQTMVMLGYVWYNSFDLMVENRHQQMYGSIHLVILNFLLADNTIQRNYINRKTLYTLYKIF